MAQRSWRSAVAVLLAALCVAATVSAAYAEDAGDVVGEKDVLVLGAGNFTDVVKGHKYVLVEFYAPWCGHCQTLAPEYAQAASVLKGKGDGVVLAKVDATEHADLGQEYEVRGYPTLLFFVNGVHKPYTGGRKADEIVSWVQKKSGPAVRVVKSEAEAKKAREAGSAVAVAFVESLEDENAKAYEATAEQEESVEFFVTDDKAVARALGVGEKAPSLVLLKKQAEKEVAFEGSAFTSESLSSFVAKNKLPLVTTFSRETAQAIFASDINKQLILFAGTKEYEKVQAEYEEAAKAFKGQIIFVLVDLAEREVAAPVLEFFSLTGDKTKLMGFVPEGSGLKFAYEGDYSSKSLKQFGERFVADKLEPYFKSEEAPETNDEAVKVVVGKSFEAIVLDESKDVLLEVYAPWCGHCQSLEPEYKKLAELLKDVKSVVVAKMDGTKNEHGRVKVEGFPTIVFFPAGKKSDEPISAGSYRTAAGLGKFVKEHAGVPFEAELPEYVEAKEGAAEAEAEESEVDYNERLEQTVEDTEDSKDEL